MKSFSWTPINLVVLIHLFSQCLCCAQTNETIGQKHEASFELGDKKLKLVFADDFEKGRSKWWTTDDSAWHVKTANGSQVFGLNKRKSNYQPKHRSPHNIALIKDAAFKDLVIEFDVKSTKDTGNHRDCCIFFCYQDPENFYYVHLGAKPDPASGQIMVVQDAPRKPLTKNKKSVGWDDDWHKVRLTYDADSGEIAVYFDDMANAHLTKIDKTFVGGKVGIGSFDDMNDFDNIRVYSN